MGNSKSPNTWRGGAKRKLSSKEESKLLFDYFADKLTLRKIAAKYGVTIRTVYRTLDYNNCKRRTEL